MLRRTLHLVVLSLVTVFLTLVQGAAPAAAADSCGSGWHKQSDGELGGSASDTRGGKTLRARISGYVRYCTRERSARPDQLNQKILIGVPRTVVGKGIWEAGLRRKCMTQTVTVNIGRIQEGTTIGMSGKEPAWSVTYGDDYVRLRRHDCVPKRQAAKVNKMVFSSSAVSVTAPNGTCYVSAPGSAAYWQCTHGPYVKSILISTAVSGRFTKGDTTYSLQAVQRETDYS